MVVNSLGVAALKERYDTSKDFLLNHDNVVALWGHKMCSVYTYVVMYDEHINLTIAFNRRDNIRC